MSAKPPLESSTPVRPNTSIVESIKNKIFQNSFITSDGNNKIDLNKKMAPSEVVDEEPCCSLTSSKSYEDFDRSFVFSPIIPVIKQDSQSICSSYDGDDDLEKNEKPSRKSSRKDSCKLPPGLPPGAEGYRKYLGIFLAIIATFVYSLATLIVKLFKDKHPYTLSVWRFQGFIIPSIPTILYHMMKGNSPVFGTILPLTEKKNLKAVFLILLRSIVGCSSTILQIYAVKMINMADASVIVFSSPVFVTLVAHVILREKAGIFSIFCALFTFAGVVIIARPPMLTGESLDETTMIGSGLALGSMLLATLVYIILRYLREVHYSVVTISYGILGSIECIILALVTGVFEFPADVMEWILAIGLILFTFAGQTALILALKFEQAGPVSLIQSTDVVFAFIWQLLFLGVYPDIYSITGAAIVIVGVTSITIRKWCLNLPPDHPNRTRFAFCLG